MTLPIAKFQIGKSGITPGIINSLNLLYKNHKIVRVSVLRSSGRDREKIKEMAEQLSNDLASRSEYIYKYTILGFTIVIRRSPKPKK